MSYEVVILIIGKQSLAQQREPVTWGLVVSFILISISLCLSLTLYVLIIMIFKQPVALCYLDKYVFPREIALILLFIQGSYTFFSGVTADETAHSHH